MEAKRVTFLALGFKDYRLFFLGSFVSHFGDQMQIVAVAWQLYALTHSATSLGLAGLFSFIPLLLFSIIGGLISDKYDRRKVLIMGQTVLAFLTGILFILTVKNQISPNIIYLLLFLNSFVNAFSQPARQSMVPRLVPKEIYMNAASLNVTQRQTATILGPALSGVLIAGYGVGGVYLLNFVSFILQILTLLLIKVKQETNKITSNLLAVFEGIKFVKNSKLLYSTMILDFLATFFGTATILMPIFAQDLLKVGALGIGLLYSATAFGGVLSGIFISRVKNLKHQGRIVFGCVILYGFATIGFGLSRVFPLSLFFLTLAGAADVISTVLRNTIRQYITPDHIRGRMTAINIMFAQGGPKLGEAEAGLLAAAVGAPMSVVVGGAGTVLITLLIARLVPNLRRYQGN